MKIGAENKKELVIMAILLAVAIPLVIYTIYNMSSGGASAAAPATTTQPSPRPQSKTGAQMVAQNALDPTLHIEFLENSRRVKYEAGGRNIFQMEAEPIPTPIAPARPENTPPPTPTPTPPPPPIPLKYFGSENKPNAPRRVFLAEGDAASGTVFVAKQGDIVDRRYRVVQITNNYVVMEDVLTNSKQQIPLTAR